MGTISTGILRGYSWQVAIHRWLLTGTGSPMTKRQQWSCRRFSRSSFSLNPSNHWSLRRMIFLQGAAEFPFQTKAMPVNATTALIYFVVLQGDETSGDALVNVWLALLVGEGWTNQPVDDTNHGLIQEQKLAFGIRRMKTAAS